MVYGTLYKSVNEGENLRTRVIFPVKLVEHYKLDVTLAGPDSHFPAEFPGKFVPSFRYANGDVLTESIPIALMLVDLLGEKGKWLYGDGSAEKKALILGWMNRWNLDFMNALATQFRIVAGVQPYDKTEYESAVAKVDRNASIINDYLTHNTYLVGETVTLADLYGAPMLLRAVGNVWGPKERAKYPALMRWFETVKHHPVFGGFFDTVEYTKESPSI